jgi:hypothetical protein
MQEIVVPAVSEQEAIAAEPVANRALRSDLIIWLAVSSISSIAISAVRWPTFLGINALPWLHQGNDYPWRVWWKARTQYVNTSHHLTLYLVMGGALAIIFLGTAVICWLLLTHSSDDPAVLTET